MRPFFILWWNIVLKNSPEGIWNRSASHSASSDAKEQLPNLMSFLKSDGEERINLAMAGFGLRSEKIANHMRKEENI